MTQVSRFFRYTRPRAAPSRGSTTAFHYGRKHGRDRLGGQKSSAGRIFDQRVLSPWPCHGGTAGAEDSMEGPKGIFRIGSNCDKYSVAGGDNPPLALST